MRKSALLLTVLVMGLIAGCGVEMPSPVPTATPTTEPTSPPPPTSAPEATDAPPPAGEAPSGSASCVVSESAIATLALDNLPPATAEDWGRGPEDAPIVLIVYSDFQ